MVPDVSTPESLAEHARDYKDGIWKTYSLAELGNFVHLLVKRSAHRSNPDKKAKDLSDAQDYLYMMQSHIDAANKSKSRFLVISDVLVDGHLIIHPGATGEWDRYTGKVSFDDVRLVSGERVPTFSDSILREHPDRFQISDA